MPIWPAAVSPRAARHPSPSGSPGRALAARPVSPPHRRCPDADLAPRCLPRAAVSRPRRARRPRPVRATPAYRRPARQRDGPSQGTAGRPARRAVQRVRHDGPIAAGSPHPAQPRRLRLRPREQAMALPPMPRRDRAEEQYPEGAGGGTERGSPRSTPARRFYGVAETQGGGLTDEPARSAPNAARTARHPRHARPPRRGAGGIDPAASTLCPADPQGSRPARLADLLATRAGMTCGNGPPGSRAAVWPD